MMNKEDGSKTFPLWLLGDSNPSRWENKLDFPLDSRHPARHSIWTPIVDVIQQEVFLARRSRIDFSQLYIRNAIQKAAHKPKDTCMDWSVQPEGGSTLSDDVIQMYEVVQEYHPLIIFTFGAFAFEFARRAIERPNIQWAYSHWTTKLLGLEFRQRLSSFSPDQSNILPLLHATIARGRFLESHRDFCAGDDTNYFSFVGKRVARQLLDNEHHFSFWL